MSMEYIRTTYRVPAARGARVEYFGDEVPIQGTIIGTRNAHIRVRMDGGRRIFNLHPTWKVRYLEQPKP